MPCIVIFVNVKQQRVRARKTNECLIINAPIPTVFKINLADFYKTKKFI